jgi:hypothetical protein
VYRSKAPLTNIEPEALVVYCSAARYQQHFAEFLVDGLNLENYSLIAVPGGIQVLTMLEYLPKFAWAGWRWTKFLIDADHPPRLVLIGHEACRWYKHLLGHLGLATTESITNDLGRARHTLAERFPKVKVEVYYARTDPQGHIVFESVAPVTSQAGTPSRSSQTPPALPGAGSGPGPAW